METATVCANMMRCLHEGGLCSASHWLPGTPCDIAAVVLAVLLFPVFVTTHVLWFRFRGKQASGSREFRICVLLYGVLWLAVFLLGFGMPSLTLPRALAGLATVGYFCLGYMQIYSLTCRGFSLRMLVDIEQRGGLDLEGVAREYSEGRGLDWLLGKRLNSMEGLGLLTRPDEDILCPTPLGQLMGRVSLFAKGLLGIGPGG